MNRSLGSVFVAFVLGTFVVVGAAGCGGGGGGACGVACGMKSTCGAVGNNLTALGALEAARGPAESIVGAAPKWVGAFKGLKITRAGLPSMEPESEIFGTKIYASGWVFKYCAGLDEVVFGAGPPDTTIEKGCGQFNCGAVASFTPPVIDSPGAIAAAFPSDPATTVYDVDLNLLLGPRVWQVTRRPSGPSVKVDADTGAVIP